MHDKGRLESPSLASGFFRRSGGPGSLQRTGPANGLLARLAVIPRANPLCEFKLNVHGEDETDSSPSLSDDQRWQGSELGELGFWSEQIKWIG